MKAEGGFTLLEVIAAFVLLATVAAYVATYYNQSMIRSSEPVLVVERASRLQSAMENVIAQYGLSSAVGGEGIVGFSARMAGDLSSFGNITIVDNVEVDYHPVTGAEFPSPGSMMLKIRIRSNESNETLTRVFVFN